MQRASQTTYRTSLGFIAICVTFSKITLDSVGTVKDSERQFWSWFLSCCSYLRLLGLWTFTLVSLCLHLCSVWLLSISCFILKWCSLCVSSLISCPCGRLHLLLMCFTWVQSSLPPLCVYKSRCFVFVSLCCCSMSVVCVDAAVDCTLIILQEPLLDLNTFKFLHLN